MKKFVCNLIYRLLVRTVAMKRRPDRVIGGQDGTPYMLRWYLLRHPNAADVLQATGWRRRWLEHRYKHGASLYLHCFLRSDDDRALHDHPWNWATLLLRGEYKEHRMEDTPVEMIELDGAVEMQTTHKPKHYDDPVHVLRTYIAGSFRAGRADDAHRIELFKAKGVEDRIPFLPWMSDREEYVCRGQPHLERMSPVWTLFATGPWLRVWGFHTTDGWVDHKQFDKIGCGETA
jgi:hypothetical protein